MKKRKYWAKVGDIVLKKTQKKYETSLLDAVSDDEVPPHSPTPEEEAVDIEETEDSEEVVRFPEDQVGLWRRL